MNSDSCDIVQKTIFLTFTILFVSMFIVSYNEHVKDEKFSDCVNNAIEQNTDVSKCKILLEH